MTVWLNLDYAAALYAAHQVSLAGGWPYDLWYIAQWYTAQNGMPIVYSVGVALELWSDIGGWTA